MKTDKELVVEFAKAWNNLDISFIQDLLVDDFRYASQWVFDEIESKRDYLKYLEAKFATVKKSNTKVIAEVGMYNKKHFIILDNIINGVSEKVTFLVETKNGAILSADMCMIPSPDSVEMLGIIPK